MQFSAFMNKPIWRVARIAAGLVLMLWGFGFSDGSAAATVLGVVGVLPLAMGLWGYCLPEFFLGHARPAH